MERKGPEEEELKKSGIETDERAGAGVEGNGRGTSAKSDRRTGAEEDAEAGRGTGAEAVAGISRRTAAEAEAGRKAPAAGTAGGRTGAPMEGKPPREEKLPRKEKPRKKKRTRDLVIEFCLKIGITALLITVLLVWVVGIYIVHTNSAYPMLKDGDLCVVFRLASLNSGDAVVYQQGSEVRFGRIVAIPGDTVDLSDDTLTVNGYGVFEDAVYPTTGEGAGITFPYTVPEGAYFILNDYRPDILDSRSFGAIQRDAVKGKIVFVMRRRGI